jgi:hypothetical protein
MIQIFSIFTVRENDINEARPHLWDYLRMCQEYGLQDGGLAQGKINSCQFAVFGRFEDKQSWEKLHEKLQQCEIEGDCFSDLMELLEKPPKFYSFEMLEE